MKNYCRKSTKLKLKSKISGSGIYNIGVMNAFVLPFLYNKHTTLEANVRNAELKVDKELLDIYKVREEWK